MDYKSTECHIHDDCKEKLELLDIAFQPIVNINTGKIYAVEALLRNFRDIGCRSIFEVFDIMYKEGRLYCFDLALRRKAIKKFTLIENYDNLKLFYNLDNRLFEMSDFTPGNTSKILQELNIKQENICFEISERHEVADIFGMEQVLQHYKNSNYCIAIDDFGVGYAGYKLLFDSTPDIIKIDRYFLQNIEKDTKKKMMVKSITHLAIDLGIKVIAEGVETEKEYLTCKEIGCHFAQGYFIQKPTLNVEEIQKKYPHVVEVIKNDKREKKGGNILKYIDHIEPIKSKYSMQKVVEYFKEKKNIPVVPVVNNSNEPVGIFYESQIKEYLYSPYGMSLLLNENKDTSRLKNFIVKCPSTDIRSDITTIIELYSNNAESSGIIITQNTSYVGFLSASNIIKIMHEENLLAARDQNPLTKMPGNRVVEKTISTLSCHKPHILCYFDLDNFKAYNDKYGFRNGDRIIQLFADILQKYLPSSFFKGHIGGDDFFVCSEVTQEEEYKQIESILATFENQAKTFYSPEDRKRGHITSTDREGKKKEFKLLSVSASVLYVNPNNSSQYTNLINNILSDQKKIAKTDQNRIVSSSLL
ncbi:bifunctional diguanylate cyclase/phosphodiesterase [Sulfurimonas sp. C5]|uniref:GGDEF domain-containing protein n=1 Tax=Sulfurimonas sp. C5 TaxID=3036947 RepID=UPI002455E9D8|nr:bifunctional diguanylate cyclase/phosphodiesterase [Sulfurimonas sp. C5]MDH4944500.1 EAL and GGDEF domain-containing protein [Sulfurimonas sp. C5]